MKAAVWHAVRDVRVEQVSIAPVTGRKVLIEVAFAGICGSDLHAFQIDETDGPLGVSVGAPHRLTGRSAPLTLGHEFSGTVVEVGPEARGVAIGDRVAIEPIVRDFDRDLTRRGLYNLGNHREGELGLVGFNDDGGFAEFCVVDDYMLHRIPDSLPLDEAALVEPMAVVFRALTESSFQVGNTAAVVGAGPIGLLSVLALKAAGAREVFLVDIVPERLAIGAAIGATVIDSRSDSPREVVRRATGGAGADVVFEAAGVQPTLDTALGLVAQGGELVVVSIFASPPRVDLGHVMVNEITISSTIIYRDNFPQVIDLMARRIIDVRPLITRRIPLDDVVADGLEFLSTDKSQAKVLVVPRILSS